MSTFAFVNTYTHTVTHVTNKLLLSFKEIIRESGLDVTKMSREWPTLERGVAAWIGSKHLEKVILEIFDASSGCFGRSLGHRNHVWLYRRRIAMGGYRCDQVQHSQSGAGSERL